MQFARFVLRFLDGSERAAENIEKPPAWKPGVVAEATERDDRSVDVATIARRGGWRGITGDGAFGQRDGRGCEPGERCRSVRRTTPSPPASNRGPPVDLPLGRR
jgi:hypothetical protein